MPFHEYVAAGADGREGRMPFIYTADKGPAAAPHQGFAGDGFAGGRAAAVLVAAAPARRPRSAPAVRDTIVAGLEADISGEPTRWNGSSRPGARSWSSSLRAGSLGAWPRACCGHREAPRP